MENTNKDVNAYASFPHLLPSGDVDTSGIISSTKHLRDAEHPQFPKNSGSGLM